MRSSHFLFLFVLLHLVSCGYTTVVEVKNSRHHYDPQYYPRSFVDRNEDWLNVRTDDIGIMLNETVTKGSSIYEKVNKTILLNDGTAENQIAFFLSLPISEKIKSTTHIPTDRTIITGLIHKSHHVLHRTQNLYNISLTHEFDGNVGTVGFDFVIFTNANNYRVAGNYTVAGIVTFIPSNFSLTSVASGINSPGLSFDTPDAMRNYAENSPLKLKVVYQPVGLDITDSPPSLVDVFSSAKINVRGGTLGFNSTLLQFGNSCNLTRAADSTVSNYKLSYQCGIAFNNSDQTLILQPMLETSGTAIIDLTFPDLEVRGEIFETEIRLSVKKGRPPTPLVLVKPNTSFLFDYFGSEIIYMEMQNVIRPNQETNATNLFIDLPMNRYAEMDLSKSIIRQPVQTIAFVVVPPGQEDKGILARIHSALMALHGSAHSKNASSVAVTAQSRIAKMKRTDNGFLPVKIPFGFRLDLRASTHMKNSTENTSLSDSRSRLNETKNQGKEDVERLRGLTNESGYYTSNIHVAFPGVESLQTAKNVFNSSLSTAFAGRQTAVLRSYQIENKFKNIYVSVWLVNYSIPTFSEHKSRQLSMLLSDAVTDIAKEEVLSGNLTGLTTNVSGIEATYRLTTSNNSAIIASKANKNKADIEQKVATRAHLSTNRLRITRIQAKKSPPSPTSAGASRSRGDFKGVSGALVAAIVILCLIALLPVVVLCVGYILIAKHRGQEQSSATQEQSSATSTAGAIATPRENDAVESEPPSDGMSIGMYIARDQLGRLNEKDTED